MDDQKPRDALDTRIRSLCGALVGIGVGFLGGVLVFGPGAAVLVIGFVSSLAFAWLAVRFGDTFWLHLGQVLRKISWLQ
jgi:hypothetical protein